MRVLLKALAEIHQAGYLHNEIQPQHVLLTQHRASKLVIKLEGLSACQREGVSGSSQYPSRFNEWSAIYRAPETTTSNGTFKCPASDIWSLGVLMYSISTGRMPFATIG